MTVRYTTKRKAVQLFDVFEIQKYEEVTTIKYWQYRKKCCVILKNSGILKLEVNK